VANAIRNQNLDAPTECWDSSLPPGRSRSSCHRNCRPAHYDRPIWRPHCQGHTGGPATSAEQYPTPVLTGWPHSALPWQRRSIDTGETGTWINGRQRCRNKVGISASSSGRSGATAAWDTAIGRHILRERQHYQGAQQRLNRHISNGNNCKRWGDERGVQSFGGATTAVVPPPL